MLQRCDVTSQKCFPSVLTASYTSSSYYKNVKRDHALNELLYKVKNLIRCSNGKNTVFWLTQKQRKTKKQKKLSLSYSYFHRQSITILF